MRWVVVGLIVLSGAGLLVWLGKMPASGGDDGNVIATSDPSSIPLRIGLIPERDIFAQRKRYRALADYLAKELNRPVELVTANSYENVIRDYREKQIDAAFLGSLVTVLAVDRIDARILVKPELPDQISSYRGTLIVPENSAIKSVDDLAGKSIAMVRTTTAGNLFPIYALAQRGLLDGAKFPRIIWVGTHDEVILEVLDARADAGALKDLRLDEFEKTHPKVKFRRLESSEPVPENAFVLRADLDAELSAELSEILLKMDSTPRGQAALTEFGAVRFLPCGIEQYKAIYDMVDAVSSVWDKTGISGPRPKRPPSLAHP